MSLLTSAITVGIIIAGLLFGVSLLPTATAANALSAASLASITSVIGYINAYSFIFPVSTIITCMVAVFIFEFSILVAKIVFWVIRTVRGGGS